MQKIKKQTHITDKKKVQVAGTEF